MNNITRLKIIVIIVLTLIFSLPLYSNATTLDEIMTNADSFLTLDNDSVVTPSEDGIKKMSNTVSNVLLTIAVGVTLISGVIMAMQFAFQSVENKAQIKESMIPWVIGILISFGAFGIWRITMSIFYQL